MRSNEVFFWNFNKFILDFWVFVFLLPFLVVIFLCIFCIYSNFNAFCAQSIFLNAIYHSNMHVIFSIYQFIYIELNGTVEFGFMHFSCDLQCEPSRFELSQKKCLEKGCSFLVHPFPHNSNNTIAIRSIDNFYRRRNECEIGKKVKKGGTTKSNKSNKLADFPANR